jgi:hydroxymethylbilane synthase
VTSLRVGTRGSRLALHQAALAAGALRAAGLGPVAIETIATTGDRDRTRPFAELGGRGIFTRELEVALLEDRIDVAVHSAKDLTSEDVPGLVLAAVLERGDPRDAWCGPHQALDDVPRGARVATGSVRRTAQLAALRPDLHVEPVRGNVDTRLRRREERGLDGVVLAACGLDRLDAADEIGFRFDPEALLPEAGQGFVALQCRAADAPSLAPLADAGRLAWLTAERTAAALLGGSCRTPIAVHGDHQPAGVRLRGWVADPDGSNAVAAEVEGPAWDGLAERLVAAIHAAGGAA